MQVPEVDLKKEISKVISSSRIKRLSLFNSLGNVRSRINIEPWLFWEEYCHTRQYFQDLKEYTHAKCDLDDIAAISLEIGMHVKKYESKVHLDTEIRPSLYMGANNLSKVIEAFKENPAFIETITFQVKARGRKFVTGEKTLKEIKDQTDSSAEFLKIEGFELIQWLLKAVNLNDEDYQRMNNWEIESTNKQKVSPAKEMIRLRHDLTIRLEEYFKRHSSAASVRARNILIGNILQVAGVMPKPRTGVKSETELKSFLAANVKKILSEKARCI